MWLQSGDAATPAVQAGVTVQPASTVLPATTGQPSSSPTSKIQFSDRLIKGKTCPYVVMVPSSWQPRLPQSSLVEYEFAKSGVGVLKVIAHAGTEDLSNIAEGLVQGEQKQLGDKGTVRAEGVERVVISGRNCVRGELRSDMRNGTTVIETFVGYSGSDGTVLLVAGHVSTISPAEKKELDEMIASLRFTTPSPAALLPRAPVIPATPQAGTSDSGAQRSVRGVSVPYMLTLPVSWQLEPVKKDMVEYAFRKTVDGGTGVVRIIANKSKEDVSKMPEQLLQGERTSMGDKGSVTMKSPEPITIDGCAGVKARFSFQTKTGATSSETLIACSGDDGTVLVIGIVTGGLNQPDGRRELETILGTLHFRPISSRPDAKR